MTPQITLIVAVAGNGVIGRDNALPWRLPSDLKRFKALTRGKPVIMGRKTYQSIGRALPDRTNIVLTRDDAFRAPGVVTTMSLDDALQVAVGDALRRDTDTIAVIGGAAIYALTMPYATCIELTSVHALPDGDAHFATPDPGQWAESKREPHRAAAGDSADFSYVTYRRTGASEPLRQSRR